MMDGLAVYWPQSASARAICSAILILGAAGLLSAVREVIRFYGREFPALRKAAAVIAESYNRETVAVDGQRASRQLVDIERLLAAVPRHCRIADRLRIIGDMKTRHVAIHLKTLQEITQAQERARMGLALPSFVANSAMVLGLLGTFIGLTDMVGTLSGIVGANALSSIEEWQRAVSGLRDALKGMNTAFTTSLFGMTAAIVLYFAGFLTRQAQASFLHQLEAFTARDLLPATMLATEEQTVIERATLTIEDAFEHMSAIQVRSNETLIALNGVQKTFLEIVDNIRAMTADKESRNLDAAIAAMSELSARIPDLIQAVDGTNKSLREGLGDLTRRERLGRRLRNLLIRNGFRRIVAALTGRRAKSGAVP